MRLHDYYQFRYLAYLLQALGVVRGQQVSAWAKASEERASRYEYEDDGA